MMAKAITGCAEALGHYDRPSWAIGPLWQLSSPVKGED